MYHGRCSARPPGNPSACLFRQRSSGSNKWVTGWYLVIHWAIQGVGNMKGTKQESTKCSPERKNYGAKTVKKKIYIYTHTHTNQTNPWWKQSETREGREGGFLPEEAPGRGEQKRVRGTQAKAGGWADKTLRPRNLRRGCPTGPPNPRGTSPIIQQHTVARDHCEHSWVPRHHPDRRDCCSEQSQLSAGYVSVKA